MRADGELKMYSDDARGKYGRGGGFGRIALGYNFFGFYSIFSGIYSKKYYYGKPYISKMKFYRPKNNQLEKQQIWRGVFRDGHNVWLTFDLETKMYWRKRAKNCNMTGFNKFMSEYLKTHQEVLA